MTGAEWLAAIDPGPMLDSLRARGGAGDRELRLLAVRGCSVVDLVLGKGERAAGMHSPKHRRDEDREEGHADQGESWGYAAPDPTP
jgi:hypothetical protein